LNYVVILYTINSLSVVLMYHSCKKGTYAPGIDGLEKVKELLKLNFSALTVVAVDREQPEVTSYKKEVISKFHK